MLTGITENIIDKFGMNLRHNNITVSFIPNFQYTQLDAATTEADKLQRTVNLLSSQIKGLIIEKSYQTHTTEMQLELINLGSDFTTRVLEGKYIIYLSVTNDANTGQANYFYCDTVKHSSGAVFGQQHTASLTIGLKSILRKRLELENNFAFELGGKGGAGAASVGVTPFDFFYGELGNLYSQNYAMDDEIGGYDSTLFNMEFCAINDSAHRVTTTPTSGYLMEANTNLEVLGYFFERYPMFKTTFGWILDEFCLTSSAPTSLRVTDFMRWDAWKDHKDQELSDYFNRELGTSSSLGKDYTSAAIASAFNIKPIEHVSWWDWATFIILDKYPKIYAINVADDTPIPMESWNGLHNEKLVMVNSAGEVKLKRIPNPVYREYLTFLNETEIGETQLYKTVFKDLHPQIDTFDAGGSQLGDIDLHTVVHFKKKSQLDSGYGKDRIGFCYKVRHEFTYAPFDTPFDNTTTDKQNYNSTESSPYLPSHTLSTRFSLLTVDEGQLNIVAPGAEDRAETLVSITKDDSPTLIDDGCNNASGTYGDGGGLPGNSNIGDQAESYITTNFSYCYGCTSDRRMDCSAFTQKAVRAAGIKNYPRTTLTQFTYCKKYGKPVSVENMQRGDILFFWFKKGHLPVSHTGVASSSTSFYHATRPKGVERALSTYKKPVGIFRLPTVGNKPTPKLKKTE